MECDDENSQYEYEVTDDEQIVGFKAQRRESGNDHDDLKGLRDFSILLGKRDSDTEKIIEKRWVGVNSQAGYFQTDDLGADISEVWNAGDVDLCFPQPIEFIWEGKEGD